MNGKLNTSYPQQQRWLRYIRWGMGSFIFFALILLVFDYGFYLSPLSQTRIETGYLLLSLLYCSGSIIQLIIRSDRWLYLRHNIIKYLLTVSFLGVLSAFYLFRIALSDTLLFGWLSLITTQPIHILLFQIYLFSNLIRWIVKISQHITQHNASPAHVIVLSFGGVILLGAGLLLPKATTTPLHPIDAVFTATSAVCVTGLIVVDTATAFTPLGQMIILTLIQLGGLGIMTVTAFFTLMVGQRMSGREQVLLGDMLDTTRIAQLGQLIRNIFLTTIAIEACGVWLLYLSWGEYFTPKRRLYTAFFHSISAFCNAGFSTFPESLVRFATNPYINIVICGLIILGGIGFSTLRNLSDFLPFRKNRTRARLSVQSRLILLMTVGLIGIGLVAFFILEYSNTLKGFPLPQKVLGAFFQSVTFRTAGFNTIDFAKAHESTLMLGIMWMFIGAAPGSTAGGIKVTTLAILLGTVVSAARGRTRLEIFHRTIPMTVLYQTLVVITMYLTLMMVISFLLSLTEPHIRPIELLFETVSALGTVGLSTGVTSKLSMIGRLFIVCTMFVGRIGPFTLALAIGRRQQTESYRYPSEKVQIG